MTKIGITERGDAAIHFDEWSGKLNTVDGAILITKDPATLLQRLPEVNTKKIIVHCTITGWGGTPLEPGVKDPSVSLAAYHKLVDMLGGQRVILRVDPIVPTAKGFNAALALMRCSSGRIRISFLDMYKHARERLKASWPALLEELDTWYQGQFHLPIGLRELCMERFRTVTNQLIEVCGEPGMECFGCVSGRDLAVLGVASDDTGRSKQRKTCHCLSIKTELLTTRAKCPHGCLYCYWR